MNILFVSTGNVCRSPIAEGLLIKKYEENNIEGVVDSAGFESFTINEPPDSRAVEAAKKFGVELTGYSRLFVKADFDKFDKIYVMDTKNYHDVKDLARNKSDMGKIDYLLNVLYPGKNKTLPDPLSQGMYDCDHITHELDKAIDKIIKSIQSS